MRPRSSGAASPPSPVVEFGGISPPLRAAMVPVPLAVERLEDPSITHASAGGPDGSPRSSCPPARDARSIGSTASAPQSLSVVRPPGVRTPCGRTPHRRGSPTSPEHSPPRRGGVLRAVCRALRAGRTSTRRRGSGVLRTDPARARPLDRRPSPRSSAHPHLTGAVGVDRGGTRVVRESGGNSAGTSSTRVDGMAASCHPLRPRQDGRSLAQRRRATPRVRVSPLSPAALPVLRQCTGIATTIGPRSGGVDKHHHSMEVSVPDGRPRPGRFRQAHLRDLQSWGDVAHGVGLRR
jgi:hypothetical protein